MGQVSSFAELEFLLNYRQTARFCPGIFEIYRHDSALVKIGVSLAALAFTLDIKTKVIFASFYTVYTLHRLCEHFKS